MLDGVSEYDPRVLADLDLDASSYTGNARFSQGFFDRAAALGRPVVLMIQETYSTRSQEGYNAGVYDAQFAEHRAAERGWTGPIAYVVSDGNGMDAWDASEYGRGVGDAATGPFEVGPGYGANGVIPSFIRGVLASRGAHLLLRGSDADGARWVPETWPGGTNAIGQVVGFSPVPDTDLNHVQVELGAPAPAPAPAPPPPEDQMELVVVPLYPAGHLSILVDAAGREVERWTSAPEQEFNGLYGPAVGAAPPGTPVRAFHDAEAAAKWLDCHKANQALIAHLEGLTAGGGAAVLSDADLARIATAAGAAAVAALRAHPLAPTG